MSALADALEAYAHAIACGAPSIVQAAVFADLTAAHNEWMARAGLRKTDPQRRCGQGAPADAFALDAYAHAVGGGAPYTTQADRFAELTAAHRSRMDQLHEAEEAVAQTWGRLLPELKDTP